MEMEFKDTARRRRILLIVVGAVLAGAAGWGAFMLANGSKGSAPVITEAVLVAARDIPARQQVAADDVVVRQVPVEEVLAQTYRESNLVLGRLTAVPVYADQQITPNLFATTAADTEFSILGPDEMVTTDSPNWRAVSVEIPVGRAVGGEITAGQHVDLIVSVDLEIYAVDADGNYQKIETATLEGLQSGTTTKITFQDLEVLKAEPDEGLYVLKVDLHGAEQLAHIIQTRPESMTLALRPDVDTRQVNQLEYGETTDSIVMRYMFRVPRLADLTELLGIPITPTAPTTTPAPEASPGPETSPGPDTSPAPDVSPAPEGTPAPSLSL